MLLWEARCERREASRAGSKGVSLGGRERVDGDLEGGGEGTLVRTSTHRSSTHKLQSKAELEDEANGGSRRLLIPKVDNITKKGEENGNVSRSGPLGAGGVIDNSILVAIRGNRIYIMRKSRSITTGGPNDHLSRRVVSYNAGVGRKLGIGDIVKVTIPRNVERVVGDTGSSGHDLRADLDRARLNAETIIHHTGIVDAAGVGGNNGGGGGPGENMVEGKERRNALNASTDRKGKINILSEGHSTGLGVVHLDGTIAGSIAALGVVARIGAATVGAATVAGVHQDFN